MVRWLFGFVVAALITGILGSVVQTQFNLGFLQALDVQIQLQTRLQTTAHDLVGFAPLWTGLSAAALLPALLLAGALSRFLFGGFRGLLYALAGFCAVVTLILVMNHLLGIAPIAATRLDTGILAMGLAGGLGGWLHARVTRSAAAP